ncbi:MAG: bifunctional diaminohydroxyphosphoribosylaminopyrimidine deaminase/5-amino-6-(5-phosphoribosylamino)uracil reductase RibD [Pseudomonadota bacterium]
MSSTVSDKEDKRFIDAALRLARKHQGLTGTNPSVGCIIVADLGYGPVIVGSAVTAWGGRPHAEPPALEEAGEYAKGATAYVTLEPCSHHGKTPPCAQALIDAGVQRVVTAISDPDNRVNGQGHAMLQAADVEVCEMDGGEFAGRVIQGYLKARSGFLPFVTLKLAMDRDGLIGCMQTGNLKISCRGSMLQTHLARARHDAILVGSGTVLADDPQLTCRLPGMEHRSPVRVVLDSKHKLTEDFKLVSTARDVQTWVVAPSEAPDEWTTMIRQNGIQHIPAEMDGDRIALPEMFEDLAARGIQSVMVEGGAELAKSLLRDDMVDEIIVHVGGTPEAPENRADAIYACFKPDVPPEGFEIVQELKFGNDVSLRLRKQENECLQA